ncbi:MAG: YcxB family protein [Planctomycetota bacterium]
MNPYDPPAAGGDHANPIDTRDLGTVVCRFPFTPEFLLESLDVYRSQRPGVAFRSWLKWGVLVFLFLSLFVLLLIGDPLEAMVLVLPISTLLLFRRLEEFFVVRNFRKSPHCGQASVLAFSDEGFRAESEIEQSSCTWSAFSEARVLDGGVLLYRGPKMVNWVPDRTHESSDGPARLRELVAAKIPSNQ